MSLISASHDSLPYIEPTPTDSELSQITTLITRELPSTYLTAPHPLLPPLDDATFSPAITQELARVAAGEPLTGGIDLTRYEPTAPADGAPAAEYESALASAYASGEHLKTRLTNLTLLNEFGKNAWLVHNSQLEQILTGLEEELMVLKTECEVVNKERKGLQKDVEVELKTLEERWRKGIGRVLEVEVAAEKVRMEILEKRRQGTAV
ncbi:hypothetical protein P167DRAFT_120150 [Morchella conica CCBAS932]|uniref:Breast carcinoma amplified sequence 2 n=1 Tax=Morchella conica CCBAS932 TaxID=1392247 RepID=A0A3N4L2U2_9PEZI|nr:hypothetical protein P167DRAFT_120150 [Morchella conica CCBAS932]